MNYLGFQQDTLDKTVDSLNELLANYHIYYQNSRNYHWNISGPYFFDLHIKFEDLYNEAKINIDDIAERILTLRKTPMSTLKDYIAHSTIQEHSAVDSKDMVSSVLSNHEILIRLMRSTITNAENAKDEGTVDLISGFLGSIEKNSWMLDAWLEK